MRQLSRKTTCRQQQCTVKLRSDKHVVSAKDATAVPAVGVGSYISGTTWLGCRKMQECRHSGARPRAAGLAAVPGIAGKPGAQEHRSDKSMAWPVFIGSGPDPDGPSRKGG